jgi:hypothetical protein
VLFAAGFLENAEPNLDSRAPQATDARPRYIRMRIAMSDENVADARLDNRVRAGTRTPRPAAGLERNRERSTAQTPHPKAALRVFERNDLGVGPADRSRGSATQHLIAAKDRGADRRVRIRTPGCPPRRAQGDLHRRFGFHFGCSIDSKNRM